MAQFDTNGDGRIKRGEFKKQLVEMCGGDRECIVGGLTRFRQTNTTKGDGVTMEELEHAFENGPPPEPEFEMPDLSSPDAVMAVFDVDGNGIIWQKEFKKKLRKICNGNARCMEEGIMHFHETNTTKRDGVRMDELIAAFNKHEPEMV